MTGIEKKSKETVRARLNKALKQEVSINYDGYMVLDIAVVSVMIGCYFMLMGVTYIEQLRSLAIAFLGFSAIWYSLSMLNRIRAERLRRLLADIQATQVEPSAKRGPGRPRKQPMVG